MVILNTLHGRNNLINNYDKRKYALSMRRIEYGVWGYDIGNFQVVTLTTREGDSQDTDRFAKDFKRLVSFIRSKVGEMQYCGCYEVSPKKGLLHWHGMFRIKGGVFKLYEGKMLSVKEWKDKNGRYHSKHLDANRRVLGDKWNELHNAFAVNCDRVRDMKHIGSYITKHIVKNYLEEVIVKNKFLISRKWRRDGLKEIMERFKLWWQEGFDEVWMSRYGWKVLNELIRSWCEVGSAVVKSNFGEFVVVQNKINDEIYNLEVK